MRPSLFPGAARGVHTTGPHRRPRSVCVSGRRRIAFVSLGDDSREVAAAAHGRRRHASYDTRTPSAGSGLDAGRDDRRGHARSGLERLVHRRARFAASAGQHRDPARHLRVCVDRHGRLHVVASTRQPARAPGSRRGRDVCAQLAERLSERSRLHARDDGLGRLHRLSRLPLSQLSRGSSGRPPRPPAVRGPGDCNGRPLGPDPALCRAAAHWRPLHRLQRPLPRQCAAGLRWCIRLRQRARVAVHRRHHGCPDRSGGHPLPEDTRTVAPEAPDARAGDVPRRRLCHQLHRLPAGR